MNKRKLPLDLTFDLLNAFSEAKGPIENSLLLQDLLTKSEIRNLARRLRIAKLLLAGKTQREISDKLPCSLATVTKVNMWLEEGGEGLRKVISKLPKLYKMPNKLPKGPLEYHLPQALLAMIQYGLYKGQTKHLKKFIESVESKQIFNEELKEVFKEEFKKNKY